MICSECFQDFGLKHEARLLGHNDNSVCPMCGHIDGKKMSYEDIRTLCERYFIYGTYEKTMFGGASILNVSEGGLQESNIAVGEKLQHDISLLYKQFAIEIFCAAPQTWRVGQISWLEDLTSKNKRKKDRAIEKLIERMTPKIVGPRDIFYRMRRDIREDPIEDKMFDAPPSERASAGRLNTKGVPVLYAAFDIETCIHECRATINDILYIATIKPLLELKLLDFTEVITDYNENTPFDMLDIAVRFLFTANSGAYRVTRLLADKVKYKGYDGIIYSSFFNRIRDREYKNIALFGRPVEEMKVCIDCVNRLQLKRAQYQFLLGPVLL